ncbi:MAG: hypothetical protein L0287_01650 [Anaerolineae bacterium]|nr:hypothetical protein [Anaerolineae bacterium]
MIRLYTMGILASVLRVLKIVIVSSTKDASEPSNQYEEQSYSNKDGEKEDNNANKKTDKKRMHHLGPISHAC